VTEFLLAFLQEQVRVDESLAQSLRTRNIYAVKRVQLEEDFTLQEKFKLSFVGWSNSTKVTLTLCTKHSATSSVVEMQFSRSARKVSLWNV
jgi:hypothetical protein